MNLYEYIENYDKEIQFENIATDEMFHSPMTVIDYMNKNPDWYKDEEFRHLLKETIAGEASCELNSSLLDISKYISLLITYRYINCNQLDIYLLIWNYFHKASVNMHWDHLKKRLTPELFDIIFRDAVYSLIDIDREKVLSEMMPKLSFDIIFDIEFVDGFIWKYQKSKNMINCLKIMNVELFKESEEKFKDYV